VFNLGGVSLHINAISSRKEGEGEVRTSGSDSSIKVFSNSIASHTPILARFRVLKSTRALILKATVWFSKKDFIPQFLCKQNIKGVCGQTVLFLIKGFDSVAGRFIVAELRFI
jgi:hypothetical protein